MAETGGSSRGSKGSGGPGGGGGYNFQARATAFVYAHVLAEQTIVFATRSYPVPLAVWAESGGPGDDVRVECRGGVVVEVQAKRGLRAGEKFWKAVIDLVTGLAEEPGLLGVLLVDSTSSATVRVDFREGLRRVADKRTDEVNAVTKELLSRLEVAGVSDLSVLRRLAVEVRDFDVGSGGHENAVLMLRGIAEDPLVAWRALEADGHDLIEYRGRRDAEALAALVSKEGGGLSAQASHPVVVARAYRDWVRVKTACFHVPGTSVSLPIGDAWAELEAWDDDEAGTFAGERALEERITSYREWSRLGLRDSLTRSARTFAADRLPLAGNRLVVVAGPGAGKTTLQQRLAHRLSGAGANVAHVRLPLVAERMRDGSAFGEAVLDLAASGSGLERAALARVLDLPDYLLVDGLDECGSSRGTVVEGLTEWAAGRPQTRVIVTTRPVGYDPALLPGWRHLELLPFDEDGARAHASNLLGKLRGDAEAENTVEEFMRSVEENETARRAAGNPLLLGFLVGLFAEGVPFGRRRADLYEKIVRQVRDREPRHHPGTVLGPAVADRAIDILAWRLQHDTVLSGGEASEALGRELEGELSLPSLAAREKAEECLNFWEERGLLERLAAGSREALVFAHAGLGEYAAARYASGLGKEDIARWVAKVRRNPRWREVLLLTAGVGAVRGVVGTLLGLYNPNDPVGEELELAARALAEAPDLPEDLAGRVVDALRGRLRDDTPVVVFGAAESALGLAREAPDLVARAVGPLAETPDLAARLAAVRLLLECGPEHADVASVERAMEDLLGPSEQAQQLPQRGGPFIWDVEERIVFLGAKRLVRARVRDDLDGLLGRAVAKFPPHMGWSSHVSLIQHVEEEGYEKIAKKAREEFSYARRTDREKLLRGLEEGGKRKIREDRVFLNAILEAAGGREAAAGTTPNAEPKAVAALVRGMELPQFPYTSWLVMVRDEDPPALRAVLVGGMAVMGIDPGRVAAEAAVMLEGLEEADPQEYRGLLGRLPEVPVDPHWERAAGAGLLAEDLVRALVHPSFAVAMIAARLLANGGGGEEAKALVAELCKGGVLRNVPQHTYDALAYLVPHFWTGDEALGKLLDALVGGVTRENRALLLAVVELPRAGEDDRVIQALVDGLYSDDPHLADALADDVLDPEIPLAMRAATRLKEVLEHWTRRGTTCEQHGGTIHGDRCPRYPRCRSIPRSPRAALVRFLGEVGLLDRDLLSELCKDQRSDVRWSAAQQASAAAARKGDLPALIRKVEVGDLPLRVLEEMLTLPPEQLRPAKEALVGLLASSSVPIREKIIGALATPGWVDAAEAAALAETALKDGEAAVRDRAVATLRTLGEGSP